MYILFTDETNMPSDPRAKIFAYGGLIIPIDKLHILHEKSREIRETCGYRQGDELKFETNARPGHVSIENARKAKSDLINLCIELECKFIVYVVLHEICKNTNREDLVKWGVDHVIGKFNVFLSLSDSFGIVALDKLPVTNEYRVLSDKFQHGLTLQDGEKVNLDRITALTSTCINASHACSAMDIVLGAFRYCINDPPNKESAETMMKNITKLIWCSREGENIYAFEKGLIFRPKEVRKPEYKQEYDNLLNHINHLIEN